MQDAFSQDMFNISDLNNPRYNGHVQSCGIKTTGGGSSGGLSLSSSMASGGKKDRKGCTKGKIEAIMKNNAVRTKVIMPLSVSNTSFTTAKKSTTSVTSTASNTNHHQQLQTPQHQQQTSHSVVFVQNHHGANRHEVLRVKEEFDDPYTFNESEPQSLGLYQAGGSTGVTKTKTLSSASSSGQHHRSTNTVVSGDRSRLIDRSTGVKLIKSSHHPLHQASGSTTSVASSAVHDQTRTGKLVQTASELSTRSPKTAAKRKVPSVSVKGVSTTSGSSSSSYSNNQSHHYQEAHQSTGVVKSSHLHHHFHRRPQPPNRICLPAKRQPRKSVWQRERNAKHELLERIHGVQSKLATYNRDLYPLGIEVSDSESDEFELEKRAVYERHWFSRTDPDVCLTDEHWNKVRTNRVQTSGADEEETPRERRVEFARAETRRRLAQTLAGVKSAGEPSTELVAAVVRAAKVVPNATALLLSLGNQTLPATSKMNRGARFLTTGEKCTYSEGCHYQALPATRHCLRHIMYNVDQRLFSHCTGRLEDNSQCNRPTFDPAHLSPLCPLHTTQAQMTVVRTSSDSRHSRKKSRLLGMSRNSKRSSKKKKKTSSSSPLSILQDIHHNNNNHHHHHHHHSNSQHTATTIRVPPPTSSNVGTSSLMVASSYSSAKNTLNYQQQSQSTIEDVVQQEADIIRSSTTLGRLQHSVGTDTAASPLSVVTSSVVDGVTQDDDNLVTVVSNVGVESVVGATGHALLDPTIQHRPHPDIVEEVSEEVLAIEALDPVELANQTTRLLEEHDLNNVLNQISTDLAFNDLFTDKNGEYEPTREETEELERALEAVDNDVRSLERMTRALPIPLPLLQLPLEGLLDTTTTSSGGGTPAGAGTSSSPTVGGGSAGNGIVIASSGGDTSASAASFDPTAVTTPTPAVVPTYHHNGYVGSPVVVTSTSVGVNPSTIVSDTLHQPT